MKKHRGVRTKSTYEFNRSLRHSVVLVGQQTKKKVSEYALKLYEDVIRRTPVDTGLARGNWFLTVGSIVTQPTDRKFTGERAPATNADAAGAGEAMADARRELADFRVGKIIWISNPLEYAVYLERGWSGQAPAGMLELSVMEAEGYKP